MTDAKSWMQESSEIDRTTDLNNVENYNSRVLELLRRIEENTRKV